MGKNCFKKGKENDCESNPKFDLNKGYQRVEISRFGKRKMWLRVEIWRKKNVVLVGGSRDGRWEVHLRT